MSSDISQAEADVLMGMNKIRQDDENHRYPDPGESLRIPLLSENGREEFMLDIARGKIALTKGTFQNRARQVIVLVRLDLGGSPHRNPDDGEIPCPHLHIFMAGYADKWAYPLPENDFTNPLDQEKTLDDFMRYCNITNPPFINRRLFND